MTAVPQATRTNLGATCCCSRTVANAVDERAAPSDAPDVGLALPDGTHEIHTVRCQRLPPLQRGATVARHSMDLRIAVVVAAEVDHRARKHAHAVGGELPSLAHVIAGDQIGMLLEQDR